MYFLQNSSVFYLRVKTHAPKNWIIIFQKNIYILEVRGANPALLLAPAEGLGPSNPAGGRSGPAMGLRPPALEWKWTLQDVAISLVPILATKQFMAPLASNLIMSGRSIRLFRPLKHKNPSTGDDFINNSGIIFLVPILANKETLAPLAPSPIIWGRSLQSFRHLECQNPSIISDSIGSPRWLRKMQKWVRSRKEEESYSYRRGWSIFLGNWNMQW